MYMTNYPKYRYFRERKRESPKLEEISKDGRRCVYGSKHLYLLAKMEEEHLCWLRVGYMFSRGMTRFLQQSELSKK